MLETITQTAYGTDHTYLKDEGIRTAVSLLTGKKTVNESDLKALTYILNKKDT